MDDRQPAREMVGGESEVYGGGAYGMVAGSEEGKESGGYGSHSRGEKQRSLGSLQSGYHAGCSVHRRVPPPAVQVTILCGHGRDAISGEGRRFSATLANEFASSSPSLALARR